MKKIISVILFLILLITGYIALQIFVIGDPVDGDTLMIEVEDLGSHINIHIATPSSAIAFSDVGFRHEGTSLHITVRKVLASSLHRSGTKSIYIEKLDETEIWLGGRLIWQAE